MLRLRTVSFLLPVLAACGGSTSERGSQTTPEEVRAPAPGAERYTTVPAAEPTRGAHAELVERAILAAAENNGVEMTGDGRLAALATWTADQLGEGGTPPPHEVVDFFSRHLGLVEPAPHLLILGQPDVALLERGITDSVSDFLARQPYNRFGAQVVERQGLTLAVVALSWRWLELEAIPREVSPGSRVTVGGRLLGSYRRPSLAVTGPTGAVSRESAGQGPEFSVEVPVDGRGVYRIELLAEGPRGNTVLANFPLFVGTSAPETLALRRDSGLAEGGTPDEIARALFRLTNRSRRQANVQPLAFHPGLSGVAAAHSQDMVTHEFVAHTSPTTGTAAARVENAGFQSGLVLENIGRGYSVGEVHRGLLESPGHRANILNPDATHIGVGVALEQEGDRSALVVTQVFCHMAAEIDVLAAPARVREAINRGRRARGGRALEEEEILSEAAQSAATEFFANPELEQQRVVDRASRGLRGMGIAFSRIGGVMTVVSELEEAFQLEPTYERDARYVGVGVAQGTRPDTGSNAIAVVILMAWPR